VPHLEESTVGKKSLFLFCLESIGNPTGGKLGQLACNGVVSLYEHSMRVPWMHNFAV